jgi:two-component system LytT family response regulator
MHRKILSVDDEEMALHILQRAIGEAIPNADQQCCCNVDAALEAVRGGFLPDIAFLDIELPGIGGLELAKHIKLLSPKTNIIFVTGYSQYAAEAYSLHARGYIMKPVTAQRICEELEAWESAVSLPSDRHRVRVQCFGNFEVFVDGAPLRFVRSQTLELLAYLVDRRGAAVNTEQLCAVLWEDSADISGQKMKLRHLLSDLNTTLKSVGADGILSKQRNRFAAVVDSFDCDYYDYVSGIPSAINQYRGEYMSQYSWAEITLGALN